ncbi:hypothetical protein [Ferrovum myxofaciens]|uniref:hypothetical protein n=1 Tax=Ferrovum myxofaciens TaxID=416213 RepID=UPI0004E10509|nr:hypothetical protein [Ferrovum myxofaciens]QKE40295.1 MAG: hypothetical protein HO274_02320 [Ferrovum myxofaciens]QKE40344.1 MAG: hypothetical protein HO274_02610 [Ferrovum myxofaciens]
MKTQPDALATYITKSTAIQAKIEQLKQMADDHFGNDPDAIHWGHVGDLDRVQTLLDELLTTFGSNE